MGKLNLQIFLPVVVLKNSSWHAHFIDEDTGASQGICLRNSLVKFGTAVNQLF